MSIDSIRINNLKVPARHGVYEYEKEKDGIFEIDLELFSSLYKSGESDKLEDTINYQDVIDATIEAFTFKQFSLVESAAQSVCNSLLNKFKIDSIIIRVRKPHAPIKADFDNVEVELHRKKNEDIK
tara:strand:- start:9423 stop:9800 length:378 start_codon:yes stop_codon:yes gene_type:complete